VSAEQLAFARRSGDQLVVVALNASAAPARLELPVALPDGAALADALEPGRSVVASGGKIVVEVPPFAARVVQHMPA
jgi:hypothetical protein